MALELTKGLEAAVVARVVEEEVVCNTTLRKCLFTMCAVGNLDLIPSARTAQTSCHGTDICFFQQASTDEKVQVLQVWT